MYKYNLMHCIGPNIIQQICFHFKIISKQGVYNMCCHIVTYMMTYSRLIKAGNLKVYYYQKSTLA